MKTKNWLYQYQFSHGLIKACEGVSSRISFENNLHTAYEVFEELEPTIERTFRSYMDDARSHFQSYLVTKKS